MMKRILTMSLLAASVVACDPYSDYSFKSGTPNIKTVSLLSHGSGLGFSGAASGSDWTMDVGCAAICAAIGSGQDPIADGYFDPDVESAPMTNVVLFVTFDRQIDGAAVQTALDDCTPAGDWLAVAGPALAVGDIWQSCYSPSSPTDVEGGSAVLFANTGAAAGWGLSGELADPAVDPTDYVFTGTLAGATVNVTLHREDVNGCGVCP